MNDAQIKFYASALKATNGKEGNFEFNCPLCGGYAVGTRNGTFGCIVSDCSECGIHVKVNDPVLKSA